MKREVSNWDLRRLYEKNDMVRADAGGCEGCHLCCTGMGTSVVLDPYDAFRLTKGLGIPFAEISGIEWNLQEGMLLPNLKMTGEEEACAFLNEEGRCSIHPYRPGLCRLFPLGRCYEEHGFKYYLQSEECPKENKSKVKIKKWLDQPELSGYEKYIFNWHAFIKELGERLIGCEDEKLRKDLWSFMASLFFGQAYNEDFYAEFEGRMEKARKLIKAIDW